VEEGGEPTLEMAKEEAATPKGGPKTGTSMNLDSLNSFITGLNPHLQGELLLFDILVKPSDTFSLQTLHLE
jgi:hypothetical protein